MRFGKKLMRFSWDLVKSSWESLTIFIFSWESHEILMSTHENFCKGSFGVVFVSYVYTCLKSSPSFFSEHNAFQMMGGWVAIVSDRKSRIALFGFACMMRWLTLQHLFMYRVWWYIAARGLEVQLMVDIDCESRLVGAGLRRGFQDNVTLSGNGN